MKRLFIFFTVLSILLISCNNNIAYEIRNKTDYDVTLVDTTTVNHPEYFVEANSIVTIDHTRNANLEIKNNTYPIEVFNDFIYSEICYLKTVDLNIFNNSNKSFNLKVLNTTHNSTSSFTIDPTSSEKIISIYCNTKPELELYYNNAKYNNYVIRDDTLIIY